jgi:hypothetical protein
VVSCESIINFKDLSVDSISGCMWRQEIIIYKYINCEDLKFCLSSVFMQQAILNATDTLPVVICLFEAVEPFL